MTFVEEAEVVQHADAPGQGHAEARPTFEEFVVARATVLLRTAWLLTGDHQLAEDLLQTALAKTCRTGRGSVRRGWAPTSSTCAR